MLSGIILYIDKTANKDYTYSYQDGNLVRITECDIILTNDGEVISRVPVNTICYVYGNDGSLEKKVYSKAELTAEYSSTDNTSTVVHTAPILNEYDEVEVAEVDTVTTTTDALGRIANEQVVHNGTTVISKSLTYHEGNTADYTNGNPTTTLVKKITEGNRTLSYTYDAEERITSCIDSRGFNDTFEYDAKGQLIRETRNGAVTAYEYDAFGNLTARGSTFNEDGTLNRDPWDNTVIHYDKDDPDKISYYTTSTVAAAFRYDGAGNPTLYKGEDLVWEKGRQLKSYGNIASFTYNANGIRTSKTCNGITYNYELEGTKLVRITNVDKNGVSHEIIPLYDSTDSPIGIIYNGTPYWYMKNLQGDILAIKDETGYEVVRYNYDAYGNVKVQREFSGCKLSVRNPFLYRGYIYDYETKLYYLQSRYYDPEICRFVNADESVLVSAGNSITPNLYAYCDNDPVNKVDYSGYLVETVVAVGITAATTNLWNPTGLIILGLIAIVLLIEAINYSTKSDIEKAKQKISKRIMKNGKIDLGKFSKIPWNGPPKWVGPLGYELVKDITEHKGPGYKLYQYGVRIATISLDGTILGK